MAKIGCPRHKTGDYGVEQPDPETDREGEGGDVRVDSSALEVKSKGHHQDATVVPGAEVSKSDPERNDIEVHDEGDEVVISWKRTDGAPGAKKGKKAEKRRG